MAFIPLRDKDEAALSLVMMGSGLLLLYLFPAYRVAAMLFSAAASARYFWWRTTDTVCTEGLPYISGGQFHWDWRYIPDSAISIALLFAEGYGFFILLGGFFQTVARKDRTPVPVDLNNPALPTVDIFVPSYNEDIDILRRTLTGALAIEYPKKRVWLLDDTRANPDEHKDSNGNVNEAALKKHQDFRAERQKLARQLGFGLITRDKHDHAKAGNINHALSVTSGDLVAIFDADHIPVRSFLQQTVGFFQSDKVALVQTPHHFYNPDPFERNLYLEGRTPPEQALFYHLIQKGNDFWNSAFFCGSCAVLRRTALEDVNGIAVETVTEDAHTALKMHAKGWESVYLDIPLAAGLATESFAAHITQRSRWAIGMVQILRQDFPLLKPGLTLPQRINYTIAASHFLFGLPRVIYLIAPASYLIFGLHPVLASARDILVFAAPHLVLSVAVASVGNRNTRYTFWPEVYETAIAAYSAYVTTQAFFRRSFKFAVTDKGLSRDRHTFDWRSARPIIFFLVVGLVSVLLFPYLLVQRPDETETILLAEVWTLFNLLLLSASAAVAYERPERRAAVRLSINRKGHVSMVPETDATDGVLAADSTIESLSSNSVAVPGSPYAEGDRTWVHPEIEETIQDVSDIRSKTTASRNVEDNRDLSLWLESEPRRNAVEVLIDDLSEGGAKLVFSQEVELPTRFSLLLDVLDGYSTQAREISVTAEIMRTFDSPGRTTVGVRFLDLTEPQRQAIISHMFTEPDRWLRDAFHPDRVIWSAWMVLTSPLVSFFPNIFGAGRRVGDRERGRYFLVDTTALTDTKDMPMVKLAPKTSLRPTLLVLVVGIVSLVSGILLGSGVLDLPTRDRPKMKVADGQEVAALDRVEELDAAYESLKKLHWHAWTATLPFSPGLTPTWQRHLWSIQYHFALASDTDPLPAETLLKDAYLRLFEAGRALQEGAPHEDVRKQLSEVEAMLEEVPAKLAQSRSLIAGEGAR